MRLAWSFAALTLGCFVDPGAPAEPSSSTAAATTEGKATGGTTTAATSISTGASGASTGISTTSGPFTPPCDAYFATEFSSAPVEFLPFTPMWAWDAANEAFRGMTAGQSAVALLTVGAWQDVRVHARLRLGPTSRAGVLVRAPVMFNAQYAYVELGAAEDLVKVWVGGEGAPRTEIPATIDSDVWLEIEASFVGTSFTVNFGGQESAIEITGLEAGAVGLFVAEAGAEFDDFYVCGP